MKYDCKQCFWYIFPICEYRDDLTRAYEEFLESKGLTLIEFEEMEIPLFWLVSSNEDLEKFLTIIGLREKMFGCLKGRNVLHIFLNKPCFKEVIA